MRSDFLHIMMQSMNADPALLSRPGVSVIGHIGRAENHVSAGYVMGEHFVVTCDPAAESMLRDATVAMEPNLDAWQQAARDAGGDLLGSGRMQLLGPTLPSADELPDGFTFERLDTSFDEHVALISRLIDRSSEDDLDEAEIDLGNLDEIVDVVLDPSGEIATYASSAPFDMAPGYGDIGILTRREFQGRGLGSIAVAALCNRLRAAGIEPLYRCDEHNVGSVKLSAGLGFEIATQLIAYRFTP